MEAPTYCMGAKIIIVAYFLSVGRPEKEEPHLTYPNDGSTVDRVAARCEDVSTATWTRSRSAVWFTMLRNCGLNDDAGGRIYYCEVTFRTRHSASRTGDATSPTNRVPI